MNAPHWRAPNLNPALTMLSIQPKAAIRVCLKCDKEFKSKGPGNRICPPCKCINNDKYGNLPEAVLGKERGVKRRNGLTFENDPFDTSF
ncbi:MAG: hypothetical protein SGI77_03880 [Pirellulaceae bacterium]|nr:hypothetical protein [Pirellulaceae bacterium]